MLVSSVFLRTIKCFHNRYFSQTKILAWSTLQEKNSLIISTEISLQCNFGSEPICLSSVDYHARCSFSLKILLGRSYQYPSCSIACIASFIQVISPGMPWHSYYCKHLLAACTSLSYSFFPSLSAHLPTLKFRILVVAATVFLFLVYLFNVFICDLNFMESFMYGGITQRATGEVFWLGSFTSWWRM